MRQDISSEVQVSFLKAQLRKATLLGENKSGAEMEMLKRFLEVERQSKLSTVLRSNKVIPLPCSKPSLA